MLDVRKNSASKELIKQKSNVNNGILLHIGMLLISQFDVGDRFGWYNRSSDDLIRMTIIIMLESGTTTRRVNE